MNPVEKLVVQFFISRVKANPQLVVDLANHLLEQAKVNPDIEKAVDDFIVTVVPELLALVQV